MKLTKGQIEEAMGRAGLVYELLEVEARLEAIGRQIADLTERETTPKSEEDFVATVELKEAREQDLARLAARVREISDLLWAPDSSPQGWVEKLTSLSREKALVAVEQVLRRRPEVTPPENMDEWDVAQIRDWLVEKVRELPEEERDAWTR